MNDPYFGSHESDRRQKNNEHLARISHSHFLTAQVYDCVKLGRSTVIISEIQQKLAKRLGYGMAAPMVGMPVHNLIKRPEGQTDEQWDAFKEMHDKHAVDYIVNNHPDKIMRTTREYFELEHRDGHGLKAKITLHPHNDEMCEMMCFHDIDKYKNMVQRAIAQITFTDDTG